ncbi:MAG: moeA1, partial [Glaciihabitans sp.]|nr:moeA1 [Glaciihabitans sp.]
MNRRMHPAIPETSQRSQRTDWFRARQICIDAATVRTPEDVRLELAIGRRLAADIHALCDIPHYSSSAMDGWAVCGEAPWTLVEAGPLSSGEAIPVVTGGLIPANSDGILRSEHGRVVPAESRSLHESVRPSLSRNALANPSEPYPGQHVRPAGEEAKRDEIMVRAGRTVSPIDVAVAASAGHDVLSVFPKPRVAIVLSGNEVQSSGVPRPGRVRDSFGPQLPSVIEQFGGTVVSNVRVTDTLDAFVAALKP